MKLNWYKITKENISKKWLFMSTKSFINGAKIEMEQEPNKSLIINDDGHYTKRFDNNGSGTYRIVGYYILFWKKKTKTTSKPALDMVAKVLFLGINKIKLKIFSQNKAYDIELDLVPYK